MSNLVHLHSHSSFSVFDGTGSPDSLAQRAAELELPAQAITDHGRVSGVVEFHKACAKHGVTPIHGMEAYIQADDIRKAAHLILLAGNQEGLHNLYRLSTLSEQNYVYRRGCITRSMLEKHHGGLVMGSACIGSEVGQMILRGNMAGAMERARWYHDLLGERYYLELQNQNDGQPNQDHLRFMRGIIDIGAALDIPVVATNDSHYVCTVDKEVHRLVLLMSNKGDMLDAYAADLSILDRRAFLRKLRLGHEVDVKPYVDNTMDVWQLLQDMGIEKVDPCRKSIAMPQYQYVGPRANAKSMDPIERIRRICQANLKVYRDHGTFDRRQASPPRWEPMTDEQHTTYRDRIEHELHIIGKTGFGDYFLIVADYVRYVKEDLKTLVGSGRGCLTGDALVLTSDRGYVPLAEICRGDSVFTHSGVQRRVTDAMSYAIKGEILLRIETEFGYQPITLTQDHKVFGRRAIETEEYAKHRQGLRGYKNRKQYEFGDAEWIRADKLKPGDQLFTPWPERKTWNPGVLDLADHATGREEIGSTDIAVPTRPTGVVSVRELSRDAGVSRNFLRDVVAHPEKIGHTLDRLGRRMTRHLAAVDKCQQLLANQYGVTLAEWVGAYRDHRRRVQRYIPFDSEMAYVVGRWIGDGWHRHTENKGSHSYHLGIAFHEDDAEGITRVGSFFKHLGFHVHENRNHQGKRLVQLIIGGRLLVEMFQSFFPGYVRTSQTKSLGRFRYLSDDLLEPLIQGLRDSDGHTSEHRESIDTSSRQLAEDVREALLYLRIPTSIRRRAPFPRGEYMCGESFKIRNRRRDMVGSCVWGG